MTAIFVPLPDAETFTADQIGSTEPSAINWVNTEGWEGDDSDGSDDDLDSGEGVERKKPTKNHRQVHR
jgi:hypothetical protein